MIAAAASWSAPVSVSRDLFDLFPELPTPADMALQAARGELEFARYSFDPDEQLLLEGMARAIAREWMKDFLIDQVLRPLARYLVDDARRSKVEGAGLRAYIFASRVLKSMQGLSQTELAQLLKVKKQSIGRQWTNLRDMLPGVIWCGMQSEAAREACRSREARKRLDVVFGAEERFEVQIDFEI